jgi:hypothetical protein
MKPRVFVGSSSEGLRIAYSLQSNLEDVAEVTVWTQDVFQPSEYTLNSLLKMLEATDMGVFVFSPDDIVRMRGAEHISVRDNVIFEFGLFVGCLGREKSIILAPRGDEPRLPSDLFGITALKYESSRQDGNIDAALGPACHSIRRQLARTQPRRSAVPSELGLTVFARLALLSDKQRQILKAIGERNGCTKRSIFSLFPTIPISELHYRLEQLRLLMFLVTRPHPEGDRFEEVYDISGSYEAALAETSSFFSGGSAPIFPPPLEGLSSDGRETLDGTL